MAQKYRYGRKRYLCCVLPKSTCYRNCSTERVCSVREEGEFRKNGAKNIPKSTIGMAPSNGCALREEGEFTLAQKYRYGRKRYLCACYQNQRAKWHHRTGVLREEGSSRWHKNTAGERDICAACYQNQRAVEGTKFNMVQKYRYGRKRYLCYVLSKTSTCTTERVCYICMALVQKYRDGRNRYL